MTQEEILEQQKSDAIIAHAEIINQLRADIKSLELKKANIQDEFNKEYALKLNAIKELENELRIKNAKANEDNGNASLLLKQAQDKLIALDKMQSDLESKYFIHDDIVKTHNAIFSEQKEALRLREAKIIENEDKIKNMLSEFNNRYEIAIAKEIEIEEKAQKLVHLSNNANNDIQILKDLQLQNKNGFDSINKLRQDLENERKLFEQEKLDNIKLKDDIDVFAAKLGARKLEIDQREGNVKANEIRQEAKENDLNLREKNLAYQESKINQLKANVELLLKQKEAASAVTVVAEQNKEA